MYLTELQADLTETLGVQWVAHKDAKAAEIVGIDDDVIRLFSKRRAQIEAYFADKPLTGPIGAIRAQYRKAVISTRSKKGKGVTTDSATRALGVRVDRTNRHHARPTRSGCRPPTKYRQAELDESLLIRRTVSALEESSSTWTHHRLCAELHDQLGRLHHIPGQPETVAAPTPAYFQNANDQVQTLRRLAHHIAGTAMIRVDIDPLDNVAAAQRVDGTDVYHTHIGGRRYTTGRILDAEQRLVDAATQPGGLLIDPRIAERVIAGRTLTDDQATAVDTVANSGKLVDVIVGPAGTGKTWTMGAIAEMWRNAGHDVIGLALSQTAAEELADATGARCENIARWRTMRHITQADDMPMRLKLQWTMQHGDLVIVDEAGIAGTFDLDELRHQAQEAGAKLLLVGDQHQLGSPNAGGAFRLIVDDVGATNSPTSAGSATIRTRRVPRPARPQHARRRLICQTWTAPRRQTRRPGRRTRRSVAPDTTRSERNP